MSDRRFNLDLIDIPIPCAVPWESMQGSDRVRFCGQCRQHVFHLSMMSRAEAEELIHTAEGKMCVQFYRRPDGTVMTRDCVAVRWTRAVWSNVALVFLAIMSLLFSTRLAAKNASPTFSKIGGGVCFDDVGNCTPSRGTQMQPPSSLPTAPAPPAISAPSSGETASR